MESRKNTTIKKTLTIIIIDDDKFYTLGLTIALSLYLKNRGIRANFYFDYMSGNDADIIFQSVRCGTCLFAVTPISKRGEKPIYFSIANRKDAHLQHLYRVERKIHVLYRHQSINTLYQHLESCLLIQTQASENTQRTTNKMLTLREQEVLYHLKQGKTPADVASCMGIKEKTISSHKRAAMKKLNFRRTNELFHWMLQGGLSSHSPRKGN